MAKTSNAVLVNHLGRLRLRVRGSGSLKLAAYTFDDVKSKTIAPITLEESPYKYPTKPANFRQMKMQIELKTTSINEWVEFYEIIPFIKPVATGFPG